MLYFSDYYNVKFVIAGPYIGGKDTYMDLKHALELAADVQPIKVDATTIDDVRSKFLYVTN